ncbi:actin-related protein 8 [Drosophila albomicans]|uniref:Actin-related protein 8 n=1 Tax=Drosophila albomicans TaxID=7291 RepID=A0A6P8XP45_DROAB|nr:actin-related protein 8 [Drosophila albomicans]
MQRSRASSTSSGRVSHSQTPNQQQQQQQQHQQQQQQPLEALKIIVIHPGSQYLRIGRAADLNPLTLLHAVAYRCHNNDNNDAALQPHHDPLLPPLDNATNAGGKLQTEFEEQRLAVSRMLQHCIVDEQNRLRVATPPQQLAHFNRSSVAEQVTPSEADEDTDTEDANVLYDEQILRLTAAEARNYDIHFPIQRGELNVHAGRGGSLQATLSHVERIWTHALEQRLGIARRDLTTHSAVLVVNDVYVRRHLREQMTLLLQRMGFQRCFLVQDSVASTYGAGLGYGCVVDIGAQKTSIACIEDGISQLDARVRLNYGGGDIDQVLLMLLRKCGFPYRECSVETSYADAHLLDELKQRFCHLHANVCGAQEQQFTLRNEAGKWLRYTLQLGDEVIMAPLSLFHTELLNITGKTRAVHTQQSAQEQYDCEDCFDGEYLKETGRRNGVRTGDLSLLPAVKSGPQQLANIITADDDDMLIVVDQDETTVSSNSNSQQQQQQHHHHHQQQQQQQLQSKSSNSWFYNVGGQVVPLDQAVIRAIGRCLSYETRRKMFGAILLVGSSAKLRGLAAWLEQRISQQVPPGVEVNVFTKGMDVGMVAWKGAAIMSVLESARELWISQREWQRYGLRILRERSPFLW